MRSYLLLCGSGHNNRLNAVLSFSKAVHSSAKIANVLLTAFAKETFVRVISRQFIFSARGFLISKFFFSLSTRRLQLCALSKTNWNTLACEDKRNRSLKTMLFATVKPHHFEQKSSAKEDVNAEMMLSLNSRLQQIGLFLKVTLCRFFSKVLCSK